MAQMRVGQPCTPTNVVWKGGLVRNLPRSRSTTRGRDLAAFIGEHDVPHGHKCIGNSDSLPGQLSDRSNFGPNGVPRRLLTRG